MLCDRCGIEVDEDAGGVVNREAGYANCGPCETSYQASLAAEYPNGYCHECGASYFVHTLADGSEELRAWHAEGGCSQWEDYAEQDFDYDYAPLTEAEQKAITEAEDRFRAEEIARGLENQRVADLTNRWLAENADHTLAEINLDEGVPF